MACRDMTFIPSFMKIRLLIQKCLARKTLGVNDRMYHKLELKLK
jgi:hypothetical protein